MKALHLFRGLGLGKKLDEVFARVNRKVDGAISDKDMKQLLSLSQRVRETFADLKRRQP